MGQHPCQTCPAKTNFCWQVMKPRLGSSDCSPFNCICDYIFNKTQANEISAHCPLLVGVYSLLKVFLLPGECCKVALKALLASQVSSNICVLTAFIALIYCKTEELLQHPCTEHFAGTLPASSSCSFRSRFKTVPEMFCAFFCSCCTGLVPERTERSCCLSERCVRACIVTVCLLLPSCRP